MMIQLNISSSIVKYSLKNNLFKTSETNKPKVETKVFISSNKQSISKEVETKK